MIIVAATQNKHKIEEISAITKPLGMEIISRKDAGVPDFEVEEDGETFEENSEKKARAIMEACGQVTIADDSGLMVDALSGAPGVYTARYAGEGCSSEDNINKLLDALKGVPQPERTARFACHICCVFPDGRRIDCEEYCEGIIIDSRCGSGGFGYDPVFYLPEHGKTFAELDAADKNAVSHRGRAIRRFFDLLRAAYVDIM